MKNAKKGSEKRSETCPKFLKPLSRRLKIAHRHFSKSFSPPKISTKKFFFSARLCRASHPKKFWNAENGTPTPTDTNKHPNLALMKNAPKNTRYEIWNPKTIFPKAPTKFTQNWHHSMFEITYAHWIFQPFRNQYTNYFFKKMVCQLFCLFFGFLRSAGLYPMFPAMTQSGIHGHSLLHTQATSSQNAWIPLRPNHGAKQHPTEPDLRETTTCHLPELEAAERRDEFLRRVDLELPQSRQRAGKPTLISRWRDRLCAHLRHHDFQIFERVSSNVPPMWWDPGLLVWLSPDQFAEVMAQKMGAVNQAGHTANGPEPDEAN